MADLVERLVKADPLKLALYTEAANEIERLRGELEEAERKNQNLLNASALLRKSGRK